MVNREILNRKDPLTGFHTKEGLIEYVLSKTTSIYDKPRSLTAIILDLDSFKQINDRYGHLVGDDALRHFSMIINQALKGQHFVSRYGGDEFVIVLYNTTQKENIENAQRIKTLLKKDKLYIASGEHIEIKTSIGIATYPRDGQTPRQLLESADQALYYAKKHGRNKIISSYNLQSRSRVDTISMAGKVIASVLIVTALLFILMKGNSVKSLGAYFGNMRQYILYSANRMLYKKNYCRIELKGDKKISGWIIEEQSDFLLISFSKPQVRLNPFNFNEALLTHPLRVPQKEITSFVKILKE